MTGSQNENISVRKVTDVHANWSDQGLDADGKFSFQLILDNGAEEVVIRPSAAAADVLVAQFAAGDSLFYDVGRDVLMVRGLT